MSEEASEELRHAEAKDEYREDEMEELHRIHERGDLLNDDELRLVVREACDWDWYLPDGCLRHEATASGTSVSFDFAPDEFDARGKFLEKKVSFDGCVAQVLEAMGYEDPDLGEDADEVLAEAFPDLIADQHVARSAVSQMLDEVGGWVRAYYKDLAKASEIGEQALRAAFAGDAVQLAEHSRRLNRLGDDSWDERRWYWEFAEEALKRRVSVHHEDSRVVGLRVARTRKNDPDSPDSFWETTGPSGLLEMMQEGGPDVVEAVQQLLEDLPTEEPARSVAISALAAGVVGIQGSVGDWAAGVLAKALRDGDEPCEALLEAARSILLTSLNTRRRAILLDGVLDRLRGERGLAGAKLA